MPIVCRNYYLFVNTYNKMRVLASIPSPVETSINGRIIVYLTYSRSVKTDRQEERLGYCPAMRSTDSRSGSRGYTSSLNGESIPSLPSQGHPFSRHSLSHSLHFTHSLAPFHREGHCVEWTLHTCISPPSPHANADTQWLSANQSIYPESPPSFEFPLGAPTA